MGRQKGRRRASGNRDLDTISSVNTLLVERPVRQAVIEVPGRSLLPCGITCQPLLLSPCSSTSLSCAK